MSVFLKGRQFGGQKQDGLGGRNKEVEISRINFQIGQEREDEGQNQVRRTNYRRQSESPHTETYARN